MASSIRRMAGLTAVGTWKVTSSSGLDTNLTNTMNLPEVGVWLVIIQIPPVTSGDGIARLDVTSGYVPATPNYFNLRTHEFASIIVITTATNASAILRTSSSAAISFDAIDRGRIQAVKIG